MGFVGVKYILNYFSSHASRYEIIIFFGMKYRYEIQIGTLITLGTLKMKIRIISQSSDFLQSIFIYFKKYKIIEL